MPFTHMVTYLSFSLSLSILTTIFPGEPGLAGFIGVKDDGSDVTSGTEKSRMSTYYQLIC